MWNRLRSTAIIVNHEREKPVVRIVGDGAVANPTVGEGRLLPVVILDTTNRPDLEEYIRLHQYVRAGDVISQWGGGIDNDNTIILILRFQSPAEIVALIEFDLQRHQGLLVEQILATNALYIQAGREGDRLVSIPHHPKIILEIPDTGFRKRWDKIYGRHMKKNLREMGFGRSEAKAALKKYIEEIRKITFFRVRGKGT